MSRSRSGAGHRPSGVDRAALLQTAIDRMLGYWAGQSTGLARPWKTCRLDLGPAPNRSRSRARVACDRGRTSGRLRSGSAEENGRILDPGQIDVLATLNGGHEISQPAFV